MDRSVPHFILRVGQGGSPPNARVDTALVGRPESGVFSVEWIDSDPERLAQARRELDFYLVEKQERNPWLYLHHHIGTGANLYSSVHWSLVRPEASKTTEE